MYKSTVLGLFCLLLFGCGAEKSKPTALATLNANQNPALELLWETDTSLLTCESVLYDQTSEIIYVANINNNPWEKDGNGFISTIDTDGNVLEHKWIEGLSGPKGMGIFENKLYVNDIDRLVEIDIDQRKITADYVVAGDPALNDITVSPNGNVYASGSSSNTIYELIDGKLIPVVAYNFGRLNGLLYRPEGIYYASSASSQFGLWKPGVETPEVLAEGIGHGDGIVQLANNDFIVSSWKGQIFYISASDWSINKLLDTEANKMNAADIDYIPNKNLLLVPTFFANKVMAYKIVQ